MTNFESLEKNSIDLYAATKVFIYKIEQKRYKIPRLQTKNLG